MTMHLSLDSHESFVLPSRAMPMKRYPGGLRIWETMTRLVIAIWTR